MVFMHLYENRDIGGGQKLRIHLCCGPQIMKDWINVDAVDFGQQVVADIGKSWEFAEEGAVSEIYCKDGFEHVESVEHFLSESARILRVGGTLKIWVPHFKNPSAYRMTHVRFVSWSYFDAFPEPHDAVQNMRVVSNKIFIGHQESELWGIPHALINMMPRWWERIGYVSNIEIVFKRV